jgi:uncharacterized protein YcfJ
MKFKIVSGVVLAFSISSEALAANIEYDYATVIDAEPIFKSIRVQTPREHCWQEEVAYETDYYGDRNYRYTNHHKGTSTVLGGVIGAAIGNAVGHRKKNKQVGAVVGAVLGASIGNAYGSQRKRRSYVTYGTEERCEVIQDTHMEERIVGYKVRYRYSNVTYSTRTKVDPGDTIRVRISISPIV